MSRMFIKQIFLICAFGLLCSCQTGRAIPKEFRVDVATQPLSPLDLSPQNISEFREVALRALNHQRGLFGANRVQLWSGKVPTHWPINLPLLDKTTIIGSLTAEQSSGPTIQVFLDVTESLENILDAYKESLIEQGFKEVGPFGFSMPIPRSDWRAITFCNKDVDVSVQLEVANESLTHVIISQQLFWFSPCSVPPQTGLPPLPQKLADPADMITQSSGSYSSGPGNQSIDRGVLTTLTLDELMTHYGTQLREQGWILMESGSSDYAIWSLWRLTDLRNQKWIGTIWISGNLISPTDKLLHMQVDRVLDQ